MNTPTATAAHQDLGRKSYAEREYGVTTKQLDRAVARIEKELDAARKAGRLKPFTGKLKRG